MHCAVAHCRTLRILEKNISQERSFNCARYKIIHMFSSLNIDRSIPKVQFVAE